MRAIRRVCGGLRGPQLCLLLLAASVAILTITAEAKPKHIKNKDDFKSCGGAMKCLGAQKLGRVRRRSGLGHKRVDEIAAQLDTDEDLVSVLRQLLGPHAVTASTCHDGTAQQHDFAGTTA